MIKYEFSWASPQAYVSINRNRLKLYNDRNYYLKNDTHFEIELFNPSSEKVLAKIHLNGKSISAGGIVLQPYQRIYLERFIDDNKKFKFTTFEVDNVAETKEARDRNGKIKIEFFSPKRELNNTLYVTDPVWYSGTYNIDWTLNGTSADRVGFITTNTTTTDTTALNYTNSVITTTSSDSVNLSKTLLLETGRVSKGEESNQKLQPIDDTFSDWSFLQYEYQILPESLKQINPQETRVYCSNCGTRVRKSSWKFCPNCGEEL